MDMSFCLYVLGSTLMTIGVGTMVTVLTSSTDLGLSAGSITAAICLWVGSYCFRKW